MLKRVSPLEQSILYFNTNENILKAQFFIALLYDLLGFKVLNSFSILISRFNFYLNCKNITRKNLRSELTKELCFSPLIILICSNLFVRNYLTFVIFSSN